MRYSSIPDKQKRTLLKGRKAFYIVLILFFISITPVVYYFNKNNMIAGFFMLLSVIMFYIFLFTSLFYLKYIRMKKYFSMKQFHEIDENKITVYDQIGYTSIENEFEWNKIKYVEQVNFGSGFDFILGNEKIGLMFVADKEKFYSGINPKIKELDKTQKQQIKLSAGFFIQCNREDIETIEAYWGKEIKKTI